MTRVIDASVACKWFFNEPLSAEARRLALPCTHYSCWTIAVRSFWAMR